MGWSIGEITRVAMVHGTKLMARLDRATMLWQRANKKPFNRPGFMDLIDWLIELAEVEVDRRDGIIKTTAEEVKR